MIFSRQLLLYYRPKDNVDYFALNDFSVFFSKQNVVLPICAEKVRLWSIQFLEIKEINETSARKCVAKNVIYSNLINLL